MVRFFSAVLDFLFPPVCPVCSESVTRHGAMCHNCFSKIRWISDPKCSKCGYPFPANIDRNAKRLLCPDCLVNKSKIDWMRAATVYDDGSKGIILPFKHAGKINFKGMISNSMVGLLKECPHEIDIIVPVPLANARLRQRGYNQSAIIGSEISKMTGIKMDVRTVSRTKWTHDMGHLKAKERKKNISGAFRVNKDLKGKNVLLIDDVRTTGATLEELAKVLKKAGVKTVSGLVFARVVRDF